MLETLKTGSKRFSHNLRMRKSLAYILHVGVLLAGKVGNVLCPIIYL